MKRSIAVSVDCSIAEELNPVRQTHIDEEKDLKDIIMSLNNFIDHVPSYIHFRQRRRDLSQFA
jgi:hypothetical protein